MNGVGHRQTGWSARGLATGRRLLVVVALHGPEHSEQGSLIAASSRRFDLRYRLIDQLSTLGSAQHLAGDRFDDMLREDAANHRQLDVVRGIVEESDLRFGTDPEECASGCLAETGRD